tara:strand:- start:77 stop:1225 length:1149 start_codon:yes stop_codon:yes gene_type:complete
MYKYKYYRKAIPKKFQAKLGLTEYKLSLKDISNKHYNYVKSLYEVEFDKVFGKIGEFDKETLKEYMELKYHETVLDLYGVKSDLIDKFLEYKANEVQEYVIEDAIEYYKNYAIDKKLNEATLSNHVKFSNKLKKYFNSDRDINNIDMTEIESFFKHVSENLGAGSINNHLSYYNSFFNYLVKKKKIIENHFSTIDKEQEEVSNRESFSKKEISKLLTSAKDKEIEMALMIQSFTGMRIGEVALIKKKNIINYDTIRIDYLKDTRTKKHNRDIPIHPFLAKYLKQHIENLDQNDKLFSISLGTLGKNVNHFIKLTLKGSNKTSHCFRYSFREHMQLLYPDRDTYTNVLTAHSNKKNIGFHIYGRNKANWEELILMVNSLSWKI